MHPTDLYKLIENCIAQGALVTDFEFDDIVVVQKYQRICPLILQCLRAEKDSEPHGTNKKNMFQAFVKNFRGIHHTYHEWDSKDFEEKGDLQKLEQRQQALKLLRAVVDRQPGQTKVLYLTIIAPCRALIEAINQDPYLSGLRKFVVMYSGNYNLKLSGKLGRWFRDPANTIIDFSRTIFFPGMQGKILSSLFHLLGDVKREYWTTIQKRAKERFQAFTNFQQSFNLHLIQPRKLFDTRAVEMLSQEDHSKFQAYIADLEPIFQSGDLAKYRSAVIQLFDPDQAVEKKWVSLFVTKKWGSLLSTEVDSPIADMVIPLLGLFVCHQHIRLQVIQGQWSVDDNGCSVVRENDTERQKQNNAYSVIVLEPENVIDIVRQFVIEAFCS
jgi:hypothetical protein